jgi:hypothetical protein
VVNFEFDPGEIVEWNGVEHLTLRTGVRRAMALYRSNADWWYFTAVPARSRHFSLVHIEQLAALTEFGADSGNR